jgi:hypothetical protein
MPATFRAVVAARAPGFVPRTYDWWHEEASQFPAIELEAAQPRVVTLVDAAGLPLSGVRVGYLPVVISDAKGRVTLQEGKAPERGAAMTITLELEALFESWATEGDSEEQSKTGEFLIQALDEDRLSERQLFPPERRGVTW